jgi:hypothetical protein
MSSAESLAGLASVRSGAAGLCRSGDFRSRLEKLLGSGVWIDLIKSFPDDTTCTQTLGPLLTEDPSGTQPSGGVSAC